MSGDSISNHIDLVKIISKVFLYLSPAVSLIKTGLFQKFEPSTHQFYKRK